MLPAGVVLRPLQSHGDERGVFTELHRAAWWSGPPLVQWNAVRSHARVLRGVHVHLRHDDLLTVPFGRATVGLVDLRPGSPTEGVASTVALGEDDAASLAIPHGVAHGFYFHEPSVHVYAVTHEFDPADELGCRFDDPDLGIAWPETDVVLSDRDRDAGTMAALRARVAGQAGAWSQPS